MKRHSAESFHERGLTLARQGRLGQAEAALRRAVGLRPGYAHAHNNLGIVLVQQNRFAEAQAEFQAALAAAPDLAQAHKNLGNVLAIQDRLDDAIICFRRALHLRADDAEALNNLGIALTDQGKLAEAVAAYEQALRLRPGYADAYNNLGVAQRFAGNLAGAAEACERALGSAPHGAAYLNLASLKRFSAADPHIDAMEKLAAQGSGIPDNSRIAVHFALGKAYDDCHEPARAFAHLLAGNRLRRQTLRYDEAAALAAMDRARAVFDEAAIAALGGQGHEPDAPIFILGMPRSGSTLIEQMLASHGEVYGAGERPEFSRLAQALCAPGPFPQLAATLSPRVLKRLGSDYMAAIRAGSRVPALRVTDKMPGNFLYAGLIHLALPRARIIHTRRNAADTCFSCFATLFRSGYDYSFDLGELGRYYRAYARLMAHWRSVIPSTVLIDVDYEDVVADPAAQLARILDHCGLPWSDACLDFQANARPVQTASATQVRQAIHRHSVGRAARYVDYLEALEK